MDKDKELSFCLSPLFKIDENGDEVKVKFDSWVIKISITPENFIENDIANL